MIGLMKLADKIHSLERKFVELNQAFYNIASPTVVGYKGLFSTNAGSNTCTIIPSMHGLRNVNSIIILNDSLVEVSVVAHVLSDNSIYIESNLPLNNFTILIK